MAKRTPEVRDGVLISSQALDSEPIVVGSDAWWSWLESNDVGAFRFLHASASFTARRERRRGAWYWYAYLKRGGELHKGYLGKSADLSAERLDAGVGRRSGRRRPSGFLLQPGDACDQPRAASLALGTTMACAAT